MGEANKRGTYEERVAAAISKKEAREIAWNKAQAERRAAHLKEEQEMKANNVARTGQRKARPAFIMAAALAVAAASMGGR